MSPELRKYVSAWCLEVLLMRDVQDEELHELGVPPMTSEEEFLFIKGCACGFLAMTTIEWGCKAMLELAPFTKEVLAGGIDVIAAYGSIGHG